MESISATQTEVDVAVFPIAEVFISPQGEGEHTGRLMYFIRLAGCTVGKPYTPDENTEGLHVYQEKCTTYDGREFACDTNFKMASKLSTENIVDMVIKSRIKHVCLTGGEPLMHKKIVELIKALQIVSRVVHIETSGTIPLTDILTKTLLDCHVAVSPKMGFREEYMTEAGLTNEVKILVDENFVWYNLPQVIRHSPRKVFLQPINFEYAVNRSNLDRVLQLQLQHPDVRISMQAHKVWGVR